MKKAFCYIAVMFSTIILIPFLITKIGGGVKSFAIEEFKKNYDVGKTVVSVFNKQDKKTEIIDVEEYLKGVVAAEMPINFELEAMKAQAIAARTYVLARKDGMFKAPESPHTDADVCTDIHCQVWTSKESVFEKWGAEAEKNWSKIEEAVSSTSGLVIVYENKLINPLYHSNSGGFTENVNNVWLTEEVPYLKSVKSLGEETFVKEYSGILNISYTDFTAKFKTTYPELKFTSKDLFNDIKITSRTESNRIKEIKIGNVNVKGTDFRMILGLKSTNFTIEKNGQSAIKITTVGNGHGVGMSQCGACYMAQQGKKYSDILTYYYQSSRIVDYKTLKLSELEKKN